MAQALVDRLGSEELDDNTIDDDPNLLNFTTVESWITC
jgi:Fe-S-cluster formation regulator IscX/YfhJ